MADFGPPGGSGPELNINGLNYAITMLRDFSVSESGQANGQTMNAGIFVHPIAGLPVPVGGNVIEFLRDGIREFHGRITSVEITMPYGPLDYFYELECVDFTADLDSTLIQLTLPADNAGSQIQTIASVVGKGFTTKNVVTGPAGAAQQ